jgi:16S rRNA (uracil1498-N3)-methyltransferase
MSELLCVLYPEEGPEPVPGQRVLLSQDESHHLVRVRRAREGREVWAITGSGAAARSVLVRPDTAAAVIAIEEVVENWREPARRVTLFQALIRPAQFDQIVELGSELGMSTLIPVETARVERKGVRMERWRRLAAESAKQCGRGWIPRIGEVLSWQEFRGQHLTMPLLVAVSDGGRSLAGMAASGKIAETGPVGLLIGPEGDFTPTEREDLRAMRAVGVHLGPRRLRSETAALEALSLLLQSS